MSASTRSTATCRRGVHVLDLVALLILGIFVGWRCSIAVLDLAFTSYIEWNRSNTPLRTPLSLPQMPWCSGFALFRPRRCVLACCARSALPRGDYASGGQTAGVASQDEEIESELASLGIAAAAGSRTAGRR